MAYNQERFILEAFEGACLQTYTPLEIILSDDCSNDRTFDLIQEKVKLYEGPHKIVLNRNEKNLGLADHVNKVVQLAKGEIVVLGAGDDISMPNRATRSWEILSKNQDSTCVSFNTIVFKGDQTPCMNQGKKSETYTKHTIRALLNECDFHINGAARSFRKSMFDQFGPLRSEAPTEDSTILLRCLLSGSVISAEESQVFYRVHGQNYYASDKKYSIDYRKIHDQYLADMNKAKSIGLIDDVLCNKVKLSLEKKLKKREIRSGFFNSDQKLVFFVQSMLFSSVFRIKEKLRFAKKATESLTK